MQPVGVPTGSGPLHPVRVAMVGDTIRARSMAKKQKLKNLTRMRMETVKRKYNGLLQSGLVGYGDVVGPRSAYAQEMNSLEQDYVYKSRGV